jgi:hypothetical protein
MSHPQRTTLQDDVFPHATVSPEQEPTMSSDQNDPDNPEALEDDPIDQMEREADGDAEQAWEESDVEEGEAPTG